MRTPRGLSLPVLGIMPEKRFPGANNLDDEVPPLIRLGLVEAFDRTWDTDAHFVAYEPVNTGHDDGAFPRINKPLLPKMRLKDADVVLHSLVLDYDNPNHCPWTPELYERFFALLDRVASHWPIAWQWTVLYTTRNGARLVYVLDEPVPVDRAEGHHRWLCSQFCLKGVAIDCTVSDWTRVFRLPRVTRDGIKTDTEPYFEIIYQLDQRLPVESLGTQERSNQSEYAEIVPLNEPKPPLDYAMGLMVAPGAWSYQKQSDWYKEAKRRLRGRECFPCLFEHARLAMPGGTDPKKAPKGVPIGRDATIHAYVGQAISLLYYFKGTTPAHIYGLFLDPVQQLEPDSQTKDWTDVLWSAICRLWAKEDAKVRAREEQAEREAQEAVDISQRILAGMRQWCKAPELAASDADAWLWAQRKLIVSCRSTYQIMRPDGWYDKQLISRDQIIPRVRAIGMGSVIETTTTGEDGRVRDLPVTTIINRYSTVAASLRAEPCIPGGYIDSIDTGNATLVLPAYRLNPNLEGKFDRDVDGWLRALFGDKYDEAAQWLAWALAFDEGEICALSIVGDPGAGKKMLVQGLAECLEVPAWADVSDLVGDYQYGLRESPFLVVNEGWPQNFGKGKHPADQFRALVSGDEVRINEKFQPPFHMHIKPRVIFTANNLDVIRKLTADRNLSPEDREALSVRLLHFDVGNRASRWLQERGGVRFTGAPHRRWIRGGPDNRSDYILARHLLWLYENRGDNPPGRRFLVEGNGNDEIIFAMQTQSGSTPLVIEALLRMIESSHSLDGLTVEEGRLYVLSSEVLSYFRGTMSQSVRQTLTANQIASAFRSLTVRETTRPTVMATRKHLGRRWWHEINLKLLLLVAQREGWKTSKIERFLNEQELRAKGGYIEPDTSIGGRLGERLKTY